jgi:hypothetical protein
VPCASDGERAVPDAWRAQHRAWTPEGKTRRTAAHTTHGHRAAPQRKALRANRTLIRRMLLCAAAVRLGQYMPAEMMAGLALYPLPFLPPEKPFEVMVSANAPRTIPHSPSACSQKRSS